MYDHYIQARALEVGKFGNAYTLSIKAQDAYRVDSAVVSADPRSVLCDNPECFFCRGTWFYNKQQWVKYYLWNAPRKLLRKAIKHND